MREKQETERQSKHWEHTSEKQCFRGAGGTPPRTLKITTLAVYQTLLISIAKTMIRGDFLMNLYTSVQSPDLGGAYGSSLELDDYNERDQ